jgi:putative endonuclease
MLHPHAFIAVYIMTNKAYGTLYIGVTSGLLDRVRQHREGQVEGFTKRYGLTRLVWYERHARMTDAIQRETSLKRYKRDWKINLIERDNRGWLDLYPPLMRVGHYDGWPGRAPAGTSPASAPPGHDGQVGKRPT